MTERREPYRPSTPTSRLAIIEMCLRSPNPWAATLHADDARWLVARVRQLETELLCARAELELSRGRVEGMREGAGLGLPVDRLPSSAATYDSVVFVDGGKADRDSTLKAPLPA